jgi:hypothetical protein
LDRGVGFRAEQGGLDKEVGHRDVRAAERRTAGDPFAELERFL